MVRSKKALVVIALIISIALSSFATLAFLQVVKASPNPIVTPDPIEIEIRFCETADIAICVQNFTDLWAFEFKIWWLKDVVEYTGYEWKPYPPEWPSPLTAGPIFDENATHESVQFGITNFVGDPFSYSGRWPFIDIYWHCIKPGVDSPLVFDRDFTKLYDEMGFEIPIEEVIDGHIINDIAYWKEPYPDYAPSGMPDFDQKQDEWGKYYDENITWTWCGPTAVANCLWWMDSRFEPGQVPPPTYSDGFPLVQSYDEWDDHDPQNVPPFIEELAWYVDCDGLRTDPCAWDGTFVDDMTNGINEYIRDKGLEGFLYAKMVEMPDFYFIEHEVERCEDVILLVGFWQLGEEMDQYQEICEWCEHVDTYWISWQEFVPTATSLSRVEVKIARTLGEKNMVPITMTIESPLGNVLTSATLPWDAVPELPWCETQWISFDVPDIPLIPGLPYYIVLNSEPLAYHWCGVDWDAYPSGASNFDSPPDYYWDWTFRTFYKDWRRLGGHYLTVAGVDSEAWLLAVSDPYCDWAEPPAYPGDWYRGNGPGRVIPPPPHGHTPPPDTVHNNATYVSHDFYNVTPSESPGGIWQLENYISSREETVENLAGQNTPREFLPYVGEYTPDEPIYTEIEYAVVVSPTPIPEDLELYPREVVILGNATCTQWHELHPSKSNYYHLTSWEPGNVLSPHDQIDMYAIDPPVKIYVETDFVDPLYPYESEWHEIEPTFCQWWRLTSWEDNNGDGYLSPCDQIDMTNRDTGEVVWFHVQSIDPPGLEPGPRMMHLDVKYWFQVDEVTVDMLLSPVEGGPQIFVDYKCGYWTFDPENPICTKWNEIDPVLGPVRCLHLSSWEDDNLDGKLSPCDIIDMTITYPYPGAGSVIWYHVDDMTITLMLTPKPSPKVVPPPPLGPMYLESKTSYDEYDLANPVCTYWHEIYPVYSTIWHLSSWEDTPHLSPSDQIVLTLKDEFGEPIPGTENEYHVDKLTVAMNLTSTLEPFETHIVKFEGSLKQFMMYRWSEPWGTQWHEVNPTYCRQWYLADWLDGNADGILGNRDLIIMIDKETDWEEMFYVESLSTDIIVTLKVHDIAVTNLTACCGATIVAQNQSCYISVTVTNEGTVTETFDLSVYWNTTNVIGTTEVTLESGKTAIVKFDWDTTSYEKYKNYTLSAYAWPVLGEIDLADNNFVDGPYGTVMVVHPGDVKPDKFVDIEDILLIALSFGEMCGQPGYNPNLDVNCDTIIDIEDILIAALNYGWFP